MIRVYYILLKDTVLLSKKDYIHWRTIQTEFYDTYIASLGPWTQEELISYLEADFKNNENWPFTKMAIKCFFESDDLVLYS